MIFRTGFVSNSSSSSFIIASKGELREELKKFKIDESNPFANGINEKLNILAKCANKVGKTKEQLKKYVDDNYYDDDLFDDFKEYIGKGFTFYLANVGEAYYEDEEYALKHMKINYKSETLAIKNLND